MGLLSDVVKGITRTVSGLGGAIIGGGASLLGGAISSRDAEKDREAAARQAQLNYEQQKEFAQHGIRWKVEDAQAAGLHPLYALGGPGSAFSPNPIVVGGERGMGRALAEAGQNLGRAVSAQETPDQRALRLMQLRVMEAQAGRDDAQAALAWTTAMRDFQNSQGSPGMPNSAVVSGSEADVSTYPVRTHPLAVDAVELKPAEQTSVRSDEPWISAARNAGFGEYQLGENFRMLAPINEEGWSEGLESMPMAMYPMWISMNVQKYGRSWIRKMLGLPSSRVPWDLKKDLEEASRRNPGGGGW